MAHTLDPIHTVDTPTLAAWTARAYRDAARAYAEARREPDRATRAILLRSAESAQDHWKALSAALARREDY